MAVEVLRLREGIELDQLQEVLARFVDLKGCPSCGLNGFDLRFEIDPRIRYRDFVTKFDGLVSEILVEPVQIDRFDLAGGRVGLGV